MQNQVRSVFLVGIFKKSSIYVKKKKKSKPTNQNTTLGIKQSSQEINQIIKIMRAPHPFSPFSKSSTRLSQATPWHKTYQGHQDMSLQRSHLPVVVTGLESSKDTTDPGGRG